jgi:hypothetical protein
MSQVLMEFPVRCTHRKCRRTMWRVPQVAAVHWAGGLPPHLESARPKAIQDHIDNAPRAREEYIQMKESRQNA